MSTRRPVAQNFYDGDTESMIQEFISGYEPIPGTEKITAAAVPHAGWFFSGATAAKTFKNIASRQKVDTFILLGAVHDWRIGSNGVYDEGAWSTPSGDVQIDSELAELLISESKNNLISDKSAHENEHSIEVQVPIIKHLFPDSKIVPVEIIPSSGVHLIGSQIAETVLNSGKDCVVVASTDLTHYGVSYGFTPAGTGREAYDWIKDNDKRIIDLALEFKAEEIVGEAKENRNACGSGALAVAVEAAKRLGSKKGYLVEYITSHDILPERDYSIMVGYAGMIF